MSRPPSVAYQGEMRDDTPPPEYERNSNAIDDFSDFAARPDFGRAGAPLRVSANMFQAQLPKHRLIYHYDIEITPVVKTVGKNEKVVRTLGWQIWQKVIRAAPSNLIQAFEQAAFDGRKNLYTPVALESKGTDMIEITVSLATGGVDLEHDRRRFRVTFQLVNQLELGSVAEYCAGQIVSLQDQKKAMSAIQAIQVLLRDDPQSQGFDVSSNGKKFVGLDGSQSIPNGGVVNYGFMASLRPTQAGVPALQLDTAYAACLRAGPLVDVIEDMLRPAPPPERGGFGGARGGYGGARGGRDGYQEPPRAFARTGPSASLRYLSPEDIKKIKPILLRCKFKVTHRRCPEPLSITGFTSESAEQTYFPLDSPDGSKKSVNLVQYYERNYGVRVTKPNMPCVIYGKSNKVPLEFVELQHFNRISVERLSGEQAAAMIKVTAKPPGQRRALVDEWRRRLDFNALPKVKAWGLSIAPAMSVVEARVLPAPPVQYKDGRTIMAQRGTWNIRGVQFRSPGSTLRSWAVVSFDPRMREREIGMFLDKFLRVLNTQGIRVENSRPPLFVEDAHAGGTFNGIKPALARAARAAYQSSDSRDPQLILCIVPKRDLAFYREVKKIALTDLAKPVVTQLLQASKINNDRGLDPYLGNLSMKIQSKLGGVTHGVSIPLLDSSTIMIGADVSHPTGRGSSAAQPSIAVTVASIDGHQDLFEHCIRLQEGRTEMIQDFGEMVKTHLRRFQQHEKVLPAKIIVFRDGVSEGQWAQSVHSELGRLREAVLEIDPTYQPKVTLVICAKRHHMRFYADHPRDQDKTGNLPAGLVVDRGVTHPFAFDFYLQAHAGLQGTAKPTHYVVVVDENGFTSDQLQKMVNDLCYTYARSCRAVSLVPVAYYADIIAGKCSDIVTDDDASSVAPSSSSRGPPRPSQPDFDPLRLKRRIDDSAIQKVAWYM